jgi:type IV pilus assembly protein PilB
MTDFSILTKEQCLEKLLESGKIPKDKLAELNDIARKGKHSIFQLIMEQELINDAELIDFLSRHVGIPLLNLTSMRVPRNLISLIPKKLIERYQIIPIGKIGNSLTVAVSDPFEIMVRDELRDLTQCFVEFVLCAPKSISAAIESYYGESSNLEEVLDGINEDNLQVIREDADEFAKTEKAGADVSDAPVVKMVQLIIDEAVRRRASDIHFEPYETDFRVRYRIDGALHESFSNSRELYGALIARVKIMSQLDITEKRLPQDGRFRIQVRDKEIDFRVSVLPIYHGEKVVLRVLDKGGIKSGLGNLGFSEKPTQAFAEAIKNPYGMILVTGPTGSGKSTTLYTILSTLNTPDRNIMTIEDPVEYSVEGITQTQVHQEVEMTFANGLRALLRQSPDVILIGEIRDTETADIGVKAALTGHLVFSTLHTNSAAGAMTRLIDMGVEPFLIANSVICVAAQRLIKRICESCKEKTDLSEEVLRRCGIQPSQMKNIVAHKGRGCTKCNHTGYYGRCGVIEVLKVDSEIRNLIIQKKSSDEIERKAIAAGMETLFENAFELFKSGVTTMEEVLRVTAKE